MTLAGGNINRIYTKELLTFINKRVAIITTEKEKFVGILKAFHPDNATVILSQATEVQEDGKKIEFHKLFIGGSTIAKIYLEEEPFDIAGLSIELERIFKRPGDIKLYIDQGLVVVLDRVKVTEKGVDGDGPVQDRIRSVFDRFVREKELSKEE